MSQDTSQLKHYKALQFDCYGTLVDWERGMLDTPQIRKLIDGAGISEKELLQAFGPHQLRVQFSRDGVVYDDVLTQAYLATAKDLGVAVTQDDADAFGASVPSWPAFSDSAASLKRLHDMGLKLIVLSNVHNAGFAETRKKLEKGFEFDAVYTAENIGSYKPDQRNFAYAIDKLRDDFGIAPDEILITANSKQHDHEPGHIAGLKGVWINRPRAIMGVDGLEHIVPDWEFPTMEAFAGAMEAARQG